MKTAYFKLKQFNSHFDIQKYYALKTKCKSVTSNDFLNSLEFNKTYPKYFWTFFHKINK